MRLCEALKRHAAEDYYPAHMPGHKGNPRYSFLGDILKYDITEIDGFDDLHDANGVILESEKYAAGLYGVSETHFLINGSTVGVISAILAVTKPGDKILAGRNCHRSVYNAAQINRLDVKYIFPELLDDCGIGICTGITGEDVERELRENPEIKTVIITSPTYEGISSDIAGIAKAVHSHGAVLIVDAAHGAHFGFCEGFPESAAAQGADIVINSVHKTLPSPTQTALLHINDVNGVKVDREEIRKQLGIYQSTSPSYLLMAGIDNCMSIISEHGHELFSRYLDNLVLFEEKAGELKHLSVIGRKSFAELYGIENADPCKLLICSNSRRAEENRSTADGAEAGAAVQPEHREGYGPYGSAGLSGRELYDILRNEYRIQPEMAADDYCLLIMTIMDTGEGFERLINALKCIDEKLDKIKTKETGKGSVCGRGINKVLYGSRPVKRMSVAEAADKRTVYLSLHEAAGRTAASYVYLYPPGIPVLVPGEEISAEMAGALESAADRGLKVQGITEDKEIRVHG